MHAAFFDVGVDAVETASFGSFSTVLAEYGIADRAHELNVAAARIAREVADDYAADGRARYVAGSIGPGTKLPSLGHIALRRAARRLRGAGRRAARGRRRPVPRSRPARPAAGEGGDDRLPAGDAAPPAAQVPLQVQVTMETTGRMLVGSEIGAALVVASPRCGPTCSASTAPPARPRCRSTCATSASTRRCRSACCPTPACRASSTAAPTTTSRPSSSPSSTAATSPSSASRVVGGCCGTTPEHLRQVVEAVRDLDAGRAARPTFEPSVSSIYSPVPIEQDLSFLIIGERTNANGSKAFRDAMLAGDWDTCTKMANEQVREGAHVLDVCVDYVGRDGAVDMDEIAKRFATQASVPLVHRLHRAAGARGRPAAHRRAGDPQLGQPRGRRAARQPLRPGDVRSPASTARRSSAC